MAKSDLIGYLLILDLADNALPANEAFQLYSNVQTASENSGNCHIYFTDAMRQRISVTEYKQYILFKYGSIYSRATDKPDKSILEDILFCIEMGKPRREIFNEYDGDFSCVIWDSIKREACFFTDPIGKSKLWYCRKGNSLILGSHVQCISAYSHEKELNPVGLDYYLSLRMVPAPVTIIKNINKITPGCFIISDQCRDVENEYWPLLEKISMVYSGSYENAKEDFLDLLKNSLSRQIADLEGPAGLFLSSGIDSVFLASMLKSMNISFTAYTAGYQDKYHTDESYNAHKIADSLGISHIIQRPETGDLLNLLKRIIGKLPEPLADAAFLPQLDLALTAQKDVDAIFDGTGVDSIFGGMNKTKADRLITYYQRVPPVLRRLARSGLMKMPSSRKWQITNSIRMAQKFIKGAELPGVQRQIYWMRFIQYDILKEILLPTYFNEKDITDELMLSAMSEIPENSRNLLAPSYIGIKIIWMSLCKLLSIGMLSDAPIRTPYLTSDMVEFGLRLPDDYKVKNNVMKRIVRDVAGHQIPIDITRMGKKNFSPPIGIWLSHEFKPYLMDSINLHGIFNRKMIEKMLQEQFNNTRDWQLELWTIFMFQIWWEEIQKT